MTPWTKISKSKLYIGQYDKIDFSFIVIIWTFKQRRDIIHFKHTEIEQLPVPPDKLFLKRFLNSCMKHDKICTLFLLQ